MSFFANKVVLVTGGTSGIGLVTASLFAEQAAQVIITARDQQKASDALNIIKQINSSTIFIPADISNLTDIENLFTQIKSDYQKLDIAINNAGELGPCGKALHEFSEQEWHQVMNVNLTGVWSCMKFEVNLMLSNGGGAIVNVASAAGLRAGKVSVAYTASKHGVVGLTKAAAVEYAKQNIRVNVVCPALIDTPMLADIPNLSERVGSLIPMGRCGTAMETATAIRWLCSSEASFITGTVLPIDGGMLA